MFDTYSILVIIAIALTVISLRWYSLLFSFVAMLGWIALWAFNISSPPAGITEGSFIHEVLYFTYIVMGIGTMLLYFRSRGKAGGSFNTTSPDEGVRATDNNTVQSRGVMDLSESEYRAYIKAKSKRRKG